MTFSLHIHVWRRRELWTRDRKYVFYIRQCHCGNREVKLFSSFRWIDERRAKFAFDPNYEGFWQELYRDALEAEGYRHDWEI